MKKFTSITAILLCTVWMAYGQWTYTNLSEAKCFMGAATVGTKAYFAGGYNGTQFFTEVEVYDLATGTWGDAGNIFIPREFVGGSVSCGSKIFFAGGFDWTVSYNIVDIYDTELEEWSVELLSVDRFSLAAVNHGDSVMFAGGVHYPPSTYKNTVDIYDVETDVWTVDYLSMPREGIAAAVVGDLALFAGGFNFNTGPTNRVDIYNFTNGTWSQASLSLARGYASSVTVGNKVIIAGGITSPNNPTNHVDIYDASTGIWTTATLSAPRSAVNNGAAVAGKAYFAGGGNFTGSGFNNASDVVDIYDPETNAWMVMNLQEPRVEHSVLGVGNNLVVAGGKNDTGHLSSVEIYNCGPPSNIIHVPGDYPSIQEGINAANPGDTVLVADSLYYENINFLGKKHLLVASHFILDGDTNHINNTIINGSQPVNPDLGSVVTFSLECDTTSVLCGFTITGGTGTYVEVASARAGGGIFIQYSGGKLLNNHIEYNQVKYDGWAIGGGVNAGGPTTPLPWIIIRDNRIQHNAAISTTSDFGEGGGVVCFYNLIMTGNEVSYNEAKGAQSGQGGGVYVRGDMGDPSFIFQNNILTHNKAVTSSDISMFSLGGGFEIWMASGVASGNVFSYNEVVSAPGAESYGSGVFIQEVPNDDLIFENNFFENNIFSGGGDCFGGGLCLWITGGTYLNNVIQNNTGTYGGGIYMGNSPLNTAIFINNTITANDAGGGGTGLHLSSSNAVVINSILYNNTPPGPAIFAETSSLEVRYSDVDYDEFVYPGEGNINCNPTFLEDGYHLDPSCQLLNAGITSIEVNGVWYNCPALDIDGEPRPFFGTQPEIGVDELQTTVSVRKPVSSEDVAVRIFPNPANRMVTLSSENGSAITLVTIYDTKGQPVYTGIPVNNMLDVSTLRPGVYILEARCGEKESKQKLIIQ